MKIDYHPFLAPLPAGRLRAWFGAGLLAGAACYAAGAYAAQGTMLRASELRGKPFLDAPVAGQVEARAEVEMLESEGGWVRIRTAEGLQGWVRLLQVRPQEAAGTASGGGGASSLISGLARLGGVATSGSTGAVATTGAKGVTPETLRTAAPAPAQLDALEKLESTAANGRRHASNAKLQAQRLDPLDPLAGASGAVPR